MTKRDWDFPKRDPRFDNPDQDGTYPNRAIEAMMPEPEESGGGGVWLRTFIFLSVLLVVGMAETVLLTLWLGASDFLTGYITGATFGAATTLFFWDEFKPPA